MCIPLGGFNMTPQIRSSAKSDKLKGNMNIIMFVQLGLAIFKMFLFGFMAALGDIISCAILYMGLQ